MTLSFRKVIALVGAVAMAGSLAACGNSNSGSSQPSKVSSSKQYNIKVWSWDSTLPRTVKPFEKLHPNIHVTVTNVGTNTKEYTALDNAIKAGSGAPDVAQVEYYALPQYAIGKHLTNLKSYGASSFKGFYTPGTWSSVNLQGGIYGLPIDSGPMALFYNKSVYDKAGISQPPKTWDEFYQDAKKIRKVGSYITSDSGDAGFFDSMVWDFGGHPFKVNGTTVSINFNDPGTQKFIQYWQRMISENLIDTKTQGWTDDWNRGLGDGSIASLLTGAWMPYNLLSGARQASGKWRVAPMPTLQAGQKNNAENGGSSLALLDSTKGDKAAAAYEWMKYVSHNRAGIKIRVDGGAFPADNQTLKDPSYLSQTTMTDANGKKVAYFGGQAFNKVLSQAAADVTPGWVFLPFEVYARNIYGDTAGAAFTGKTTLSKGIAQWGSRLNQYGSQQGFTMKK